MSIVLRRLAAGLAALLSIAVMQGPPLAFAQESADGQRPDFAAWLEAVRSEALERGISRRTVDAALTGLEPVERVVERDRSQAEYTLTLETYMARVVTPETVARGKALMAQHADLLGEVARRYGVQPRFIVAIWGIESRFGSVRGTMPVVPAVATLAYDRRRSTFFRGELMAALTIVDRGYIELDRMLGSWAGAMGQPQFIPTSYLAYAQDFDGDGRRDIWENEGDVFASIASYLARHGWSDDQTWGREVAMPNPLRQRVDTLMPETPSGCRAMKTLTREMSLPEWQALGLRRASGDDLPGRDLPAALVFPDGTDGRAFIVYKNYRSILRYNCAHHYAVTVGTLADRIDAP